MNREHYRELYSHYTQRHLRERKKQVERRIAELEQAKREYNPKKNRGSLHEAHLRNLFLNNCKNLEKHRMELEVIQELIKPRLVNWKVCFAIFAVGFVLFNGTKSEKMGVDKKDSKPSTSVHSLEEEDPYTFKDAIRDIVEITEEAVENNMSEKRDKR